jgi:gliding motility-associated-like protein
VKKIALPFIMLFLFCAPAWARHIAGGEMSYQYLGPGGSANSYRYLITLRLYRDCQSSGAQLDPEAAITIYQNGTSVVFRNLNVKRNSIETIQLTSPGPCINNPPIVCYQIGVYTEEVELPASLQGYTIAYQRCCRIDNITNVINSGTAGATYTATIPGTSVLANAPQNSSARFNTNDTVIICENNGFIYNFSATDADGDELTYVFAEPYEGPSQANAQPPVAGPPPYPSLSHAFGFSASSPMGAGVSLNGSTGIISGTAPASGIYVITVAVMEKRQGQIINIHRKDLHIKVAPCTIAAADLQPEYITCDGFNLTFFNRSNSPLIRTYFWDFGLQGITADTSNQERPTFVFPDTGTFKVMLITNRGQECSDTAYSIAKVYPGFFPAFTFLATCKGVPMRFIDNTTTRYGAVNKWRWSFGYPQTNPDTSVLRDPVYTYPSSGTYPARLIVSSSKGCIDTVDQPVQILDKPTLQVTNDTLICSIDTLQLSAVGIGSFAWSPGYNISDVSSPAPLVSPDVPSKYYVTLTAAPGCSNVDSVFVDVKQFVTLDAGPDTTICLTDTVRLNPFSDALSYRWAPVNTLNNPGIKNPVAKPADGKTTYNVVANIGKCQASDDITIRTVPYPAIRVSNDTAICFGDTAILFASGGIDYRWTPSSSLSSNVVPGPSAFPLVTTTYRVAVTDNAGCPKPSFADVLVRVVPPVPAFAGRDTAIVVGQPLQLNAAGGSSYVWSPPAGLNRNFISNPVANLSDDISYIVKVSTEEGCFAFDTINVRVFKTAPDIFVPTAFTPNGDGLNDVLKPIPVGITNIEYFRVYNRWGVMVFSTNAEQGGGWDGRINGREQGSDTFVWYVRGTDFTGKIIFKKGSSTLIR